MFNPFKPLELIKAEVFTSLPTQLRKKSRTAPLSRDSLAKLAGQLAVRSTGAQH